MHRCEATLKRRTSGIFIFLHKSMAIDHVARSIFCLECAAFYFRNRRKKRPPKLQPLHSFIRCWPINIGRFWMSARASAQSSVVCNVAINIYMGFAGKFIIDIAATRVEVCSVQWRAIIHMKTEWYSSAAWITFFTHFIFAASRFSAFPTHSLDKSI